MTQIEQIKKEINRLKRIAYANRILHPHTVRAVVSCRNIDMLDELLDFIGHIHSQELKPKNEELDEAAQKYAADSLGLYPKTSFAADDFIAGAQWQKEKDIKTALDWLKSKGGFTIGIEGATIVDFERAMRK